jgi:hypothetical protein
LTRCHRQVSAIISRAPVRSPASAVGLGAMLCIRACRYPRHPDSGGLPDAAAAMACVAPSSPVISHGHRAARRGCRPPRQARAARYPDRHREPGKRSRTARPPFSNGPSGADPVPGEPGAAGTERGLAEKRLKPMTGSPVTAVSLTPWQSKKERPAAFAKTAGWRDRGGWRRKSY